ncbi:MAG: hypothetical protein GXO79_00360 [Chlorobi bacterium]|nr:hypothetical protein [Chlorobiota bacterium]
MKLTKSKETPDLVIYPAPPDTARIQFLTSFSNSKDITGERSPFVKFILGEDESMPITKPYGVHIHKGKIYICDTGLGGLIIVDLEKSTFNYFVPKGKGQLKLPLNSFVDNKGYLYIADGQRKQIVVFDSVLNYVNSFGEIENFKPTDVFVYDNKIWVPNSKNNCVNVYSKDDYKLLNKLPDIAKGDPGYLYSPTNIYLANGDLYVSDFGDFKIKKYNLKGEFLSSVGSYGRSLGQFVRPKGIAVDKESNLYVVDAGFENTQIFNKDGQLLMYFGGPYQGPGDMWLPTKVVIDYDNLKYFQKYVDDSFNLKYIIIVSNQYGPDKINIYGAIRFKNSKNKE